MARRYKNKKFINPRYFLNESVMREQSEEEEDDDLLDDLEVEEPAKKPEPSIEGLMAFKDDICKNKDILLDIIDNLTPEKGVDWLKQTFQDRLSKHLGLGVTSLPKNMDPILKIILEMYKRDPDSKKMMSNAISMGCTFSRFLPF